MDQDFINPTTNDPDLFMKIKDPSSKILTFDLSHFYKPKFY
ncbi:hypothetical protein PPEP_b0696 [Pseudoalteromonas peptidolytica F12-50-A1]|uniref:Uncharacterized protein n=1 Tax=Pseudoalteromonas peptidolytica F12-50-A1 TaxID=1315280 RepID=A0A8I0N0G2_9GAMM|nr:hypothetical protein [Pseudoalteromonas peptidolytica F12-50-A1]